MSTTVDVTTRPAQSATLRRRPTLLDAVRWEAGKLAAQLRARVTLLSTNDASPRPSLPALPFSSMSPTPVPWSSQPSVSSPSEPPKM